MELGSWSLITAPSLLALIPLIVMIVLVFRGKSNVSGMMVGIILGALMMGQDLGALAKAFSASLGSTTALIGVIIMTGAGLGVLMTETGVTHTLVYWIVKRIGVNTPTKGKLALVICSILICGLLGTLGGGNAVIAPIMLPILASLGVTPTVVATLFKVAGEIGLMVGPLTGVTLITMEVTGLSYGQLMLQAVLPFSCFWLAGAWIGCNRAQKRTMGKEAYSVDEDIKHLDSIVITPRQKRTTAAFLVAFVLLVVLIAVCWWKDEALIRLFRDDPEVTAVALPAFRYQCFAVLLQPVIVVANMTFQSVGKAGRATFLACCRQGVCFIPLILVLPRVLGLVGVELCQPIADALTFFISLPFLLAFLRQLEQMDKAEASHAPAQL